MKKIYIQDNIYFSSDDIIFMGKKEHNNIIEDTRVDETSTFKTEEIKIF